MENVDRASENCEKVIIAMINKYRIHIVEFNGRRLCEFAQQSFENNSRWDHIYTCFCKLGCIFDGSFEIAVFWLIRFGDDIHLNFSAFLWKWCKFLFVSEFLLSFRWDDKNLCQIRINFGEVFVFFRISKHYFNRKNTFWEWEEKYSKHLSRL